MLQTFALKVFEKYYYLDGMKKKPYLKWLGIGVLVLMVGAMLSKKEVESTEVDSFELPNVSSETAIYETLQTEISALEILQDRNNFLGSVSSHSLFFNEVDIALEAISEAEMFQVDSITGLSNQLKKDLSSFQEKYLPILRKEYLEEAKQKVWLEDVKLSWSGKGNTNLLFIGSMFAANQNKQDFMETIQPMMMKYRFKKVSYKWYEYDEDGVTYTINSKEDKEI